MTAQEDAPYSLYRGNVLNAYRRWPTPATIISDGAYGVRGFHGDTTGPESLGDWYAPHIEEWSRRASPATTLWFWNTEVGWATVHPQLVAAGWEYVELIVWDKGIAHVAGNVNVGNGRDILIDTLSQLVPWIGYPRTLNGLAAVNEIAPFSPGAPTRA